MGTESFNLLLKGAAEALYDCDRILQEIHIRKKFLAQRKSPYDRVPIHSRRFSEPTQYPYTAPDELRILKEGVNSVNELMKKCIEIETNMPRKRHFPMPVAFQSNNANLKCEKENLNVIIESLDVSLRALIKQNEVKLPDFSAAFENIITPGRGSRENYASRIGTSHQTHFRVRGVDNPPASLHASNDRDLEELCDKFTDVMSTESLSDRKK